MSSTQRFLEWPRDDPETGAVYVIFMNEIHSADTQWKHSNIRSHETRLKNLSRTFNKDILHLQYHTDQYKDIMITLNHASARRDSWSLRARNAGASGTLRTVLRDATRLVGG